MEPNEMFPGGYNPQMMAIPQIKSDDTFDKWRFDIEELLIEKEYNIMGYFWDPKAVDPDTGVKGTWVQKGEPRVNEIGAKAIRTAMSGIVNKVSTLTTLTIDEIHEEIKILSINLSRLFFLNHEKYALKSPTDAQDLLWQLVLFAFNGIKQSEGGLGLKSLAEMTQTQRHIYEDHGGKKGGFMGIFKRGDKK